VYIETPQRTCVATEAKAVDREQRGMRMHLKSLLDLPDDEDDDPEDPDLIDEDAAKSLLAEIQELTALATA
jgi:hypothetical protein